MARDWNGLSLQTELSEQLGDTSTSFKAKVLTWINDVQADVCARHDWPFLLKKGKKTFASNEEEQQLTVEEHPAPSVTLASGGSLTEASVYKVMVTYYQSTIGCESETTLESASVTTDASNLTITVSGLQPSVDPLVDQRRVYLIKDGGDPLLYTTIEDTTTASVSITADVSSTVEAPDYHCIRKLHGDPFIETTGSRKLIYKPTDQVRGLIEGSFTTGTPEIYSLLGEDRLAVYPKPNDIYAGTFEFTTESALTFSDSTLFTVNSDTGTRLAGENPDANETLFASFKSSTDADRASGSTTGTVNGTGVAASADGIVISDTNSNIEFDADLNADFNDEITIEMRITYSAASSPTNAKVIWVRTLNSGSTTNQLKLTTGSNLIYFNNVSFGSFVIATETEYHISVTVDYANDLARVFIDGVEVGSGLAFTEVDDEDSTIFKVGSDKAENTGAFGCTIREVVVFNSIRRTGNFTPTVYYSTDTPYVETPTMSHDTLTAASVSGITQDGTSDLVKIIVYIGSQGFYYDGSAWAASDGTYSQSMTTAVYTANIATLVCGYAATVKLRVFFYSDGTTTSIANTSTLTGQQDSDVVSYYFYKTPKRLVAASDSIPDMPHWLKPVLKAGVLSMGYEYRDRDGQESKLQKYEELLSRSISDMGSPSRDNTRVRDVVGDADGYEV